MVVNLQLFKLYKEIYPHRDKISPLLFNEFKKVIFHIDEDLWQTIENKFTNNIEWTYSLEEKMIFTIIALKMPSFLDKDPELCGELCTLLDLLDKLPQNYVKYANIFFNEPIYSNMLKVIKNNIDSLDIFEVLFEYVDNGEVTETELNKIIRILYKIQEKSFNIIINPKKDLKSICLSLLNYVKEINKTCFTFTTEEIKVLSNLYLRVDCLTPDEIKTIKTRLQEIDDLYTNPTIIIKTIIKEIPQFYFTIPNIIRKRTPYDK